MSPGRYQASQPAFEARVRPTPAADCSRLPILAPSSTSCSRRDAISRAGLEHAGQPLGLAGELGSTYDALSPDRRKLVAGRAADDAGTIGLWVFDFERNLNSRVPFGGRASSAVWAPDGEHMAVAWAKGEEHPERTWWISVPQRSPEACCREERFAGRSTGRVTERSCCLLEVEPASRFDIWAMRMTGADRTPIPVVRGPGKDNEARFSPDGRFITRATIAAKSRSKMRFQPERGPRVLVSDGEAGEPRWREGRPRALLASQKNVR